MKRGYDRDDQYQYTLSLCCGNFIYKLKQNQNIKGFKTDQMDKEVKNIQHDNALKNIDSVNKALDTIRNFCIHAGSKININKTECILLGPLKSLLDE